MHGYGMRRYLEVMNEVMIDYTQLIRKSAQSWDTLFAECRERDRQLDQMKLDVLGGTPYVKAYLIT
jgi:hypothetical protein